MLTVVIITYYFLNGRRESLTELNLLKLSSEQCLLVPPWLPWKGLPLLYRPLVTPHLPWIPSEFSGCLSISKSCRKAQSYLHALIRCSFSFLPTLFFFFLVHRSAFLSPPILILPAPTDLTSQMEPQQTALQLPHIGAMMVNQLVCVHKDKLFRKHHNQKHH